MCLFLYLQFSKFITTSLFDMKHLYFFLLLIIVGCSNPNKPEKVVQEFYLAVKNKDIAKAKSLATNKSQSMLDLVGENLELTLKNGKITAVDCITEGEVSECDCFFEQDSKPLPLSLKKENDLWKLDIQSSAANALDDLLDNFKEINLNGLLDKVGEGVNLSTEGINELIEKMDIDKAVEALEGIDSAVGVSDKKLEGLIEQFSKSLKK